MRYSSIILMGAITLAVTVSAGAGEPAPAFAEDFAEGDRWKPLPGVTVEIAPTPDRAGNGLHFHGRQDQAWNFASTAPFPLAAGAKYRVTAWLRLADRFGGYPPFLKVQLLGARATGEPDPGKPHGQVVTSPYEPIRGDWQQLSGEFETPAGTAFGWLAIEKGVQTPVEIDGWLADVRVVPIATFATAAYPFERLPAPLAAVKGIHPRLYRTRAGFEELRRQVEREPYRTMLRQLHDAADSAVRTGPASATERDGSGDEQLWQRPVGNQMANLAMAYRMTGERKYLETATAFIRASAGYPTWGLGSYSGWDLAAAHQLYGMALAYDWLYDDLDADTRALARACLEKRGRFMFEEMVKRPNRHRSYLQNHLWVNLTGLATAGLALYGDEPEVSGVEGWIRLPLEKYRTVMAALGPDGASHEGVPYWSYGLEYMLKFMDLARSLLGVDLFAGNEWFRRTASYRLYSMLPRNSWRKDSSLMTFADGPRADWYGPDYLLRKLASEYRDGHAQWLANELAAANLCGSEARFLNLIWFDPTVPAAPPTELPTFKHFPDIGLVFMRSGWAGDESVLAFKCGPALGHQATRRFGYDPGAGHAHPDAGALQLFAHGEWLLTGSGYCFKRTAFENTLLIDGHGQAGEGQSMFDAKPQLSRKLFPAIRRAAPGPEFDLVSADVAPAYDAGLGLRRFDRHVAWFRPDCWVVIDAVESAAPATFSLLFHTDTKFTPGTEPSRAFVVQGTNANLVVTPLWPPAAVGRATDQDVEHVYRVSTRHLGLLTIESPAPATNAVFVTLLQAYAHSGLPAVEGSVAEQGGGLVLTMRSRQGARKYRIDLAADRENRPLIRPLE